VLIERAPWLDSERRWPSPIPAATSIAGRSARCIRLPLTAPRRREQRLASRGRRAAPALWLLDRARRDVSVRRRSSAAQARAVELVAAPGFRSRHAPNADCRFRGSDDGQEHVALVVGAFGGSRRWFGCTANA
jgi:GTP cyclohydrolase II